MTMLTEFWKQPLPHGIVHALGWTLLHFCWQGALVAGLLWCVLVLLGGRSARVRYGFACAALLLMVALPLMTLVRLAAAEPRNPLVMPLPAFTLEVGADGAGDVREPLGQRLSRGLDAAAPWIPAVWAVGLVVFLGRLNYGLIVAGRLKSSGMESVPADLLDVFGTLKKRLGVKSAVRLLQSAMVQVPTVIGWLQPIVLVPAGCFLGLSPVQVEALLAHELAHIRRHDYLVSVLQSVVEALLFYHPAVWWVSRQVRRERECCCDEMAVGVGGDALAYALALACLEESRAGMSEVVLSANGGVLAMRIKRLLGSREDSVVSQATAFVVLSVVVLVGSSYVAAAARAQTHRMTVLTGMQEEPLIATEVQSELALMPPATPYKPGQREVSGPALKPEYKTWLEQDVVWIITAEERTAFLKLTNDEGRDAFITNFWARRDPPGSAAGAYRSLHYARIAYANQHFAGDNKSGWKSDRGHIYIAYGKPESIESHPSGGQGSAPFEVWHYGSISGVGDNVDIRFVDTCRCGDYRYTIDQAVGTTGVNGKSPAALGNQKLTVKTAYVSAPPSVDEPVASQAPVVAGAPMRVSAGVMAGNAISQPAPVYPPIAKAAHVQGTVVLRAIISKSGEVTNLQVVSGTPMLTSSALDAVRRWTYKPYLLNGQPQEIETSINVNFTLPATDSQVAQPHPWVIVNSAGSNPIRVSGGVAAGMLTSSVNPVYPAEAKAAKIQGVVVLHAIISKTGTVEDLNVVSGPPPLLVSAIDAVRQWKYKPYLLNGEPTAVETTINVNYTLGERTPDNETTLEPGVDRDVKKIGGSVSAPLVIYQVQPEYSEAARKAKFMGIVLVNLIVDTDGHPQNVHVTRAIGMGLDEKAVEAVKLYRFKPAMENGIPVRVELNIEVRFQLDGSGPPSASSSAIPPPAPNLKDGITPPVVISQVEPEFTLAARKAKASGRVLVNLIVDKKGKPQHVHVLRELGYGLDKNAVDAVKQYRFRPAMKEGKPVDDELNVEVNFQMF